MRIVKLSEVLNYEPGENVPGVSGTMKAVFDVRAGKKKDGTPWTAQNFVLADGNAEMKVCAWNRESLVSLKGKQVVVLSGVSKKDGKPCGVSVKLNNWTDKEGKDRSEKVIDVTDKGEIARRDTPVQPEPSDNDGGVIPQAGRRASVDWDEANPDNDEPLLDELPQRTTTAAVKDVRPAETNGATWAKTGAEIKRIGELYKACTICITNDVVPMVQERSGYAMTPEHVASAVATIFIEFNRRFGLDSVPNTPLPTSSKK